MLSTDPGFLYTSVDYWSKLLLMWSSSHCERVFSKVYNMKQEQEYRYTLTIQEHL